MLCRTLPAGLLSGYKMHRVKTFILVLLAGFVAGGLRATAAGAESAPVGSVPSFVKDSAGSQDRRAEKAMISSARVPFVANEGQIADPQVKYYAKTFGGTVYALSGGRIVYSLPQHAAAGKTVARSSPGSVLIQERLFGALASEPFGAGKSRVAVNSFIGRQPEKWKTNLPAFDRLDLGEVYEGISLLLSARGNNVEKIFVLSPGADPRDIVFGFEGTAAIEITDEGELELQTALGPVRFTRPVAWQIDARGKSLPVTADYVLGADDAVRFQIGVYDRDNILVIDPFLASTFVGGGGADAVQAVVFDAQTNIYVAGYTDSGDFPVTNNPYQDVTNGQYDAFVSRFDANLGILSASTYLGGSANDQAFGMGIDSSARIWLVGYTESTDFPTPSSPMSTNYNGNGDAFVAILASNLDNLVQATYLGGVGADSAAAIAMNNLSERQYIVGYTESTNFPVTAGAYKTTYNGGARDAFVVFFSNTVSSLSAGTFLGGTNADEATALAVSPVAGSGVIATNFVCIVGSTSSTNFPATGYQKVYGGGDSDAFVCRMRILLNALPQSTFLGGTGSDTACSAGLDGSNGFYVAGYTSSTNFPCDPSNNVYLAGWTNAYNGGQDVFVTHFTNNLALLYASTYIGGANDDVATSLAVDSNTNRTYVYLAGYTTSSNFPATPNTYDSAYNGGEDAFVLRMDGSLTNLYASTYLGGGGNDRAQALALSPDSNELAVAGVTASSDFPASDAAYETAFRGGASDGFAAKLPASLSYGTVKWRKFLDSICSSPALAWDGTIVVGAGPSTGLVAFTSAGSERWRVVTTSSVAKQIAPFLGLGVPAVGTNNFVYISTDQGEAYAISGAGLINWSVNFGVVPGGWSAMAIDNISRLFFAQNDKFYAFSQGGAGLWTNSLNTYAYPAPAISSNGTIYAANTVDPNASVYAFNTNGSTIWNTAMSGYMYSSPALDSNGTIYAASGSKLYAFNSGGTNTRTWSAAGSIYSSPAVGSNGIVYVGGGENLYAFAPGGTTSKIWNILNAAADIRSSPAICADGSILVGAADDTSAILYSFNSDGTTNWTCRLNDFDLVFQSPLVDSEGMIYVSDASSIFAVYGSQPAAESAWPMYRHDALRTGNQGLDIASFLRPAGLSVSKGTVANYIRAGWNASANALNYELWRNTNDSTAGAGLIRRLTQTNYNDSSVEPGKIYYYWLKVKTPIAKSAFSASDSGGIPPYPPTGLSASDGVPTNYVQLTWQASSNATLYYIYRSLINDTNKAELINLSAVTNYADYTVVPGLTHYYWVKAGNGVAGVSGFSVGDSGGIPCQPPAGLSASKGAYIHSVALSWNASTGASSYIVYRNTEDNSAAAEIINNVVGLGTNDSSGTPMRRYYYWLKATNEFGLSAFSASDYGWSLLAPPQAVYASAGTFYNMVRVSWIVGSTDAIAHVIFRSESPNVNTAAQVSEVVYNSSADTNYDDTAITRGISYYYWVAAKNSYGTSALTAAGSSGGISPATPNDLSASDGAYIDRVNVTWTSSPGAAYYLIYRHETFDSSYATQIGSALTNNYDDTSALNGVLYYYWVKAGNNYGISVLSTFNSGWRAMSPPDSVTAGDGVSTSEVSVTWSAAPNATAYELWRGTAGSVAAANRLANNLAATSYSDQTANPGTVYYYWVKSKRGIYTSAFSGSASGYRAIGLLDIGVSDFVFVPTVLSPLAHPSAVSFKVSNFSALDMFAPNNTIQYDLYLSPSATFGGGDDYWIGGSTLSLPLNAGASARVVCPVGVRQSIVIPSGAAGSYYVFVFVNHSLPSAWHDPNLANNTARRLGDSITIAQATAFQPVWNDYDGDGKTDLAVYQERTGGWRFWLSTSGYALAGLDGLGEAGYRAVPRDYDGDGRVDPAVYQESTGTWRIALSASGYQTVTVAGWGGAGQYAVPADYDGDRRVDPAVYQESPSGSGQAGMWRVWPSASGYAEVQVYGMGGPGCRPVPADYDGDQRADPAVYQSAAGGWRVWLSGSSYQEASVINWGGAGQTAVPADYDGDGRVDPAVYQESSPGSGQTGIWRVWASSGLYREINVTGWGDVGQSAVPGDYDGDGKVDPVVYWESLGVWRLWLSSYLYSEINILKSGGLEFHAITFGE